jgi:hypothetical protein
MELIDLFLLCTDLFIGSGGSTASGGLSILLVLVSGFNSLYLLYRLIRRDNPLTRFMLLGVPYVFIFMVELIQSFATMGISVPGAISNAAQIRIVLDNPRIYWEALILLAIFLGSAALMASLTMKRIPKRRNFFLTFLLTCPIELACLIPVAWVLGKSLTSSESATPMGSVMVQIFLTALIMIVTKTAILLLSIFYVFLFSERIHEIPSLDFDNEGQFRRFIRSEIGAFTASISIMAILEVSILPAAIIREYIAHRIEIAWVIGILAVTSWLVGISVRSLIAFLLPARTRLFRKIDSWDHEKQVLFYREFQNRELSSQFAIVTKNFLLKRFPIYHMDIFDLRELKQVEEGNNAVKLTFEGEQTVRIRKDGAKVLRSIGPKDIDLYHFFAKRI